MHTRPVHKALMLFLILALALGACSAASSEREVGGGAIPEMAMEEVEAPAAAPAYDQRAYSTANQPQQTERLVIKNAHLALVVPDPAASMDRISALADEMGGFVVYARLSQIQVDGVDIPRADVTIRVLSDRLDEALKRIEAESDRLPLDKNISSEDVTAEYTDLQSRLRNLEAAEAQLREMMDRATRSEDVLNIYQQLTQTREEIEVIKGRIQYFETSARLSSISVSLQATAAVRPLTIGSWQPEGVAREALQALISALRSLANAVIWIILFFLPVAVLIALPLYLVVRLVRRWRGRARKPAAPPAPPASAG